MQYIRFLVATPWGTDELATVLVDPRFSADTRVRIRPGSTEAFTRPSDEHDQRTVSIEADPETRFEHVIETIVAFDRTGANVGVR